ncbi:MAG: MBL fold metallo-hydrolase [Gemmatimonadaceae bacterium]|nr:MBL fold metallo-hydrolase [Gemmatimonadaceae bacterium]
MCRLLRPLVMLELPTLLALCIVTAPLGAQAGLDTVQVRTTALSRNVYMLTGAGGNLGLSVGDDAVFLVDDQFAPLTPKILAAIATVTNKPIRFVVNTHWHFDHTGGNENMGKAGALIVAHENVRKRMSTEQFMEALNRREPPSPRGALPVITFTDGVTFHINDDSLVVTHMPPGHTDGDAIVYFTKANVLHTGDTFLSAALPFVDLSSGGSINGIITTAERVYAMANDQTKIIPGHGAIADRNRVRAFRDMLVVLRDRMKAEVGAGKTVDQVLAANITAAFANEWPNGHERFVRLLYQETSRR